MFLTSLSSGFTGPLKLSYTDKNHYIIIKMCVGGLKSENLLGAECFELENQEWQYVQRQIQLQQALNHLQGFGPHKGPAPWVAGMRHAMRKLSAVYHHFNQ